MNKNSVYSWSIIENNAIYKTMDKSFYTTGVTGIPVDIRWFFNCQKYTEEDVEIGLWYKEKRYEGRIEFFSDAINKRTRMYTKKFFTENKNEILKYNCIMFSRINENEYLIKLFNNEEILEDTMDNPFETKIIVNNNNCKQIAYYTTKYERLNSIRDEVIKVHGLNCEICGFNFEKKYGHFGEKFIDIHHLKPIYNLNESIEPNIERDFISICTNCHRIIHRCEEKMLTPEELRKLIKEKEEIDDLLG